MQTETVAGAVQLLAIADLFDQVAAVAGAATELDFDEATAELALKWQQVAKLLDEGHPIPAVVDQLHSCAEALRWATIR
jgi:DNA-binding FrmR family transcriptional regulator